MINHLKASIEAADIHTSKLCYINDMSIPPGMSGKKVKHLLNNICSKKDTRYLEVGLWQGSTMCSALYNNEIRAIGVDNWSEYSGPREQFFSAIGKFVGKNKLTVAEGNCYEFFSSEKFNVFFFDGGHSVLDHYRAIAHFGPMMDNEFILIVDDFKSPEVYQGTGMAIADLRYDPIYENFLGADAPFHEDTENWWNGVYCAVIRKPL